ncbi:MAG: hypothetical protein AB1630_11815, partial [bacterium]
MQDLRNITGSFETVYDLTKKLAIFGKYAIRKISYDEITSQVSLMSMQANYDLSDKVDLGTGIRLLSQDKSNDYKVSPFLELGYKPEKDIRISLGYNFIHYHDGQIPELDYSAS